MVFLLFQMSSSASVNPDFSDFQFTLPKSQLYYSIEGDDFDFTLHPNKLNFTVDE